MNPTQLRVVSWNLNCGVFTESDAPTDEDSIPYITRCLRRLEPDVVALQEVLFPRDGSGPSQASLIARELGIPHVAEFPLSPSHLIEGADLGLAILSQHPVTALQKIDLPNPHVQIQIEGAETWTSHDKGLLTAGISSPAGEIGLICGHLLPFHRFHRDPSDPAFEPVWQAVRQTLLSLLERPVVGCIDFNTESVAASLPGCFEPGRYQELIHQPTRPSGARHDQILCSHHWHDASVRILPSRFDHHLCSTVLHLGREHSALRGEPVARAVARSVNPFTLLHLSDLHFGEGTREDVDWKVFLEFATRETRRDRLTRFLRSLPKQPDYVIVSGDVTIAGRVSGYASFVETFEDLIRRGHLPSADRIVVVPGNHDVVRNAGSPAARWEPFLQHVGMRFVRPWLPDHDPPPDELLARVDASCDDKADRWGGIRREEDDLLKKTNISSLPFVFDRSLGLLIYAFNSAAISGTRIQLSPDVQEEVRWLRSWDHANRDKVLKVLAALEREISVDPSRIDPPELALFSGIVERLKRKAGHEFETAFKIAVLHHHVAPVLSEEVTKFESLLNAGRFKRELKDEGFHLVLHGHKHWPEVFQDSSLPGERPLWVISGGTIGGGEASGREPGFYLLDHIPGARRLSARFVPLTESGNPRLAFDQGRVQDLTLDSPLLEPVDHGELLCLPQLAATTERALLSYLRHQVLEGGAEWWGWSHALDENRVSMIATAYGLRILGLLHSGSAELRSRLPLIQGSLLDLRHPDGAWCASSQGGSTSQPEPTAYALAALHAWNHPDLASATRALEAKLEPSADRVLWQHIFSLATITRTLAECDPASVWLPRLTEALRQAAHLDSQGSLRFWGRQTLRHADDDFGPTGTRGSVIHTAHAVLALSKSYRLTQGLAGASPAELWGACAFLLEEPEWSNTTEDINRLIRPGKYDGLVVKHFTSPWVIVALLEAGADPGHSRIRTGIRELLRTQRNGLWDWGSVERPIWATHDALCALTTYAAVAARA